MELEATRHSGADPARLLEYQMRLADIESAVRGIKVARPFEFDLLLLRMHLGMAQEAVTRMGAGN
jgi:hypothetical protein